MALVYETKFWIGSDSNKEGLPVVKILYDDAEVNPEIIDGETYFQPVAYEINTTGLLGVRVLIYKGGALKHTFSVPGGTVLRPDAYTDPKDAYTLSGSRMHLVYAV